MNINRRDTTLTALTLAISLALANSASAQSMQHGSMPMEQGAQTQTQDHSAHQAPTSKPAPVQKPATPTKKSEATIDHAAMGHAAPPAKAAEPAMQGMDHSQMGHGSPASTPAAPTAQAQSMQGMDHSQMGHGPAAPTQPRTPIPAVTDADRKAAIAPEHAHPVHDNSIKSYVLLNRLETWDADPGTGFGWEGQGWIGTDLNRVWLRSEGERTDGQTESADLEVLYGRSISTWWDVVAGVRHDFKPGASQNFAAIGVQGLAPMKFEVSATAYLGEGGQTAANVEAEYELLLTNRLILQPLVEVTAYGKNDPLRGIGSGLSTAEAGLRLRYEFTRKFAPYIGVVYERAFGNTADMRREHGESFEDTRLVIGLRTWF